MLQGRLILTVEVQAHDDICKGTAYCEVVDVEEGGFDEGASLDAEMYLCHELQLHASCTGLTVEEFERAYPVGKKVRVAYTIQPIPGSPRRAVK